VPGHNDFRNTTASTTATTSTVIDGPDHGLLNMRAKLARTAQKITPRTGVDKGEHGFSSAITALGMNT